MVYGRAIHQPPGERVEQELHKFLAVLPRLSIGSTASRGSIHRPPRSLSSGFLRARHADEFRAGRKFERGNWKVE